MVSELQLASGNWKESWQQLVGNWGPSCLQPQRNSSLPEPVSLEDVHLLVRSAFMLLQFDINLVRPRSERILSHCALMLNYLTSRNYETINLCYLKSQRVWVIQHYEIISEKSCMCCLLFLTLKILAWDCLINFLWWWLCSISVLYDMVANKSHMAMKYLKCCYSNWATK